MISLAVAACGSGSAPPPQTAQAATTTSGEQSPSSPELGQGPSMNIGGEGAATPESHSMSQAQQTQPMQQTPPSGATAPDQGQGSTTLNDNEIAAIVAAANTGEVEQAKLAQTRAKDARVKKFAAHMVSEHTEAGQKETQV
ncbi:MAG: DUF4142 domain-containing protein, partial [Polyangiaceae bacterium]